MATIAQVDHNSVASNRSDPDGQDAPCKLMISAHRARGTDAYTSWSEVKLQLSVSWLWHQNWHQSWHWWFQALTPFCRPKKIIWGLLSFNKNNLWPWTNYDHPTHLQLFVRIVTLREVPRVFKTWGEPNCQICSWKALKSYGKQTPILEHPSVWKMFVTKTSKLPGVSWRFQCFKPVMSQIKKLAVWSWNLRIWGRVLVTPVSRSKASPTARHKCWGF